MIDRYSYRWSFNRKYDLLIRIADGTISFADAAKHYNLTDEELATWLSAFKLGPNSLKAKQLRERRSKEMKGKSDNHQFS